MNEITPTTEETPLQEILEEAEGIKHELEKTNSFGRRFIVGIFTGLGTVVGATVVVALLLYVLSLFSDVGIVGDFTSWITETIRGNN